eukprot:TRINITY_DN6198_c0_g1_i1.p1 TRINITY_DN6198_c0_g1~~TRINITY_DN6198_c0_g1_i1.p1  ORF type:complete len:282 (-),score=36.45 TRINITY_DN6198_c0_g1_i1:598-1443(-)
MRSSAAVREHASVHYMFANSSDGYPVNHLRNFAIEHMSCRTKWTFPLDADFVPGAGTDPRPGQGWVVHDQMLADLEAARTKVDDKTTVFLVPGFECDYFPCVHRTKPKLLEAVSGGATRPVLKRSFFLAHENVDYPQWYAASAPYSVRYDFFFEPYYAGLTEHYVEYNEGFSFYGHDKASHTYELMARGWGMAVLPHSFAVHGKHEDNWSAKPDRPAVYRRIAAHMREMFYKYKFWPELPSEHWFNKIFTDGDAEQAEFKKELVRFLWEQLSARTGPEITS